MRAILHALLIALLLGGCSLIAYEYDRARLAGCEPWQPGCPIEIDFSGGPSRGSVIAAGAGVETTSAPVPPALSGPAPADSLSVPAAERTASATSVPSDGLLGEPPTLPGAPEPGLSAVPRVRTTIPGLDRVGPGVAVPGPPSYGGFIMPGRVR